MYIKLHDFFAMIIKKTEVTQMYKKILLLSMISFLQLNADDYFIKLGAFKMNDVLKENMSNLPENLRKKVIIVKKEGWLIPIVKSSYQKDALTLLPKYQNYFKDATVSSNSKTLTLPVVRRYKEEAQDDMAKMSQVPAPTTSKKERKEPIKVEKKVQIAPKQEAKREVIYKPRAEKKSYTTPAKMAYAQQTSTHFVPPVSYEEPVETQNSGVVVNEVTNQNVTTSPVVDNAIHNEYQQAIMVENGVDSRRIYPEDKVFSKELLSGRVFYLANKSDEKDANLLVKATFENHKVNYTPILGNMKIQEANFIVQDEKLYMFEDQIVGDSAYSNIEANEKEYLLVSSWQKNKKINTLRYYHNLDEAKGYLGLSNGNKLSSVLESGDFDHKFIKN